MLDMVPGRPTKKLNMDSLPSLVIVSCRRIRVERINYLFPQIEWL